MRAVLVYHQAYYYAVAEQMVGKGEGRGVMQKVNGKRVQVAKMVGKMIGKMVVKIVGKVVERVERMVGKMVGEMCARL